MSEEAERTQQYESSRSGALVAIRDNRSELILRGSDSQYFLHNFCTQDIKKMSAGQGGETFFCDVKGKTIGFGVVYLIDDALIVETTAGQAQALHDHLDRYLIREDVTLEVRGDERAVLAIIGPQSQTVLESLFGSPPPQGLGAATHQDVVIRNVASYGCPAWHLDCPAEQQSELVNALIGAGATFGNAEILKTLRVEAGTPEFGTDFNSGNLPQELCRDATAISFTKGCYLGQETVARIDALGHVNRQLVSVKQVNGQLREGADLVQDEKLAGRLTSVVESPAAGCQLGLGIVRRESAAPGVRLQCGEAEVQVIAPP